MAFMFSHTMFNINQLCSKLFSMANYKHNILVLGIIFLLHNFVDIVMCRRILLRLTTAIWKIWYALESYVTDFTSEKLFGIIRDI